MKKGMQNWGMFMVMFLLSFGISSYALGNRMLLELFRLGGIWETMSSLQIRMIQLLFSTLAGMVPKLCTFFSERRKAKDLLPRLTVSFHSVSCIRRNLNHNLKPVLSLGEGDWFVYIQVCISNPGSGELRNISVNGQDIGKAVLAAGEKYQMFLRLCENSTEGFQKRYKFQVDFKDDRELCFTKDVTCTLSTKTRRVKELRSTQVRRRFAL